MEAPGAADWAVDLREFHKGVRRVSDSNLGLGDGQAVWIEPGGAGDGGVEDHCAVRRFVLMLGLLGGYIYIGL